MLTSTVCVAAVVRVHDILLLVGMCNSKGHELVQQL